MEQKNGAIVRKLTGYDRLSGIRGAERLAKLYEFSRLYVNCFQPSFKLKSKTRTGARVSKRYHSPVTPYDRVMASPSIPEAMKARLKALFDQLDPIELIHGIRCVQAEVFNVKYFSRAYCLSRKSYRRLVVVFGASGRLSGEG